MEVGSPTVAILTADTTTAQPTRWQKSTPFLKGLAGGLLGAFLTLFVVGLFYVALTAYRDHQALQAIIGMINRQAAQQAPQKPSATP